MPKIMITGANGFVGRRLLTYLHQAGHSTRAVVRRPSVTVDVPGDAMVVGAIDGQTDWRQALVDCEVVVHLAARVHAAPSGNPVAAFRTVNLDGSVALARAAAHAGVTRFVYNSTIEVNGVATYGQAFTPRQQARPVGPYAESKWQAEQALRDISAATGMEVVIIRPPLVYGPGVQGHLNHLVKLARSGIPLPLLGIRNRRTLVALDNLVDLIATCCHHPAADGQLFLVGDAETVSTAELYSRISRALGRSARLFYLPPALLSSVARLLGLSRAWRRWSDSLEVDSSETMARLGWQPVVSMDAELELLAEIVQQS